MSSFPFHFLTIFSLDIEFWVDNCFLSALQRLCSTFFEPLWCLMRSKMLSELLFCLYRGTVLYYVVLCGFSLDIPLWLSTVLMLIFLDIKFTVFILLGISISYLQNSVLSSFGSFLLFLLLISLLKLSCNKNMLHTMKKLRVVTLKSLYVSANIWFILELNLTDILLSRE